MRFNEINQVKASEPMPKKKGGRKDHPYKGRLVGEDAAQEPDPQGYQKDLLTMPPYTLVIDTAGDLDWYKLGQHFANLNKQDPHEWGQGDSDMVITLANQEQVDRVKAILDRFGATYKDIGGSSEHPEVHVKEFKVEKPNPKDTLNIKRKDMPQVASKDYDELFDYLKQNGANFKKEIVPARSLKAVQGEFSDKGIENQIQKNIDMGVGKKPLIASKDNYIIDGHHRWLAAINTNADLHIIRVNMSVRKLLNLVKKFPKTTYKDIHENLNEGYNPYPVKTLKGLYHVGTMDSSKKRDGYEGAGISVSTHPDAWRKIARGHVTGDTHSATKEGNKFLDAHNLSDKHKEEIKQWAIKNDYLAQQETVTVCYYDDEMEDDLCSTFNSMADAEAEYADELEFMDVTVAKGGIVPTDKLKKETRQNRIESTGVLDFVLPIFAEQQGLDGVWWQDTLDVQRYSAPRGVIVPSKIKSWKFAVKKNESINEGYKIQLERADDMYILHILDTETNKRTEVRGKSDYETTGYDADDKLHQLLDKIGKSANISELINGEVVTINPKHPDAEKAKAATDVAFNEETGVEMLKIFRNMHHDTARNKEMDAFIKAHQWELRDFTPDMFPSEEEFFDYDDPFDRIIDIDYNHRVDLSQPIIVGPPYSDGKYSVIDGNHRAARAQQMGKTIKGYFPVKKVNETAGVGRVVKGVNTTVDVGPNEIIKQVKKFGNDVDRDGKPKKHLK